MVPKKSKNYLGFENEYFKVISRAPDKNGLVSVKLEELDNPLTLKALAEIVEEWNE